jgi:hypothetical protein
MSTRMQSLLARVDELPIVPIARGRVWPVPSAPAAIPSRRSCERLARQIAVVHQAQTPRWAAALLTEPSDPAVHVELAAAGLL